MLSPTTPTPTVTVVDVASAIDDGSAYLLDVREPFEFDVARVDGAALIPLGALPTRAGELPADQPIHVICRSGNRSDTAARALVNAGFDAYNVEGGMLAWQAARLPMQPDDAKVV